MKKIIAAVSAFLIAALLFTGCGFGANNTATTTASKSKVKYSSEFKNYEKYLKKHNVLTGDMIKTFNDTKLPKKEDIDYKYGFEIIGATSGKKYSSGNIVVELYEFEKGKKNEYVSKVKKDGYFTLYDKKITAFLNDDDRFMFIYSDKAIQEGDTSSDAYKLLKKAVKVFNSYDPAAEEETTEETTSKTSSKSDTESKTKSDTKSTAKTTLKSTASKADKKQ